MVEENEERCLEIIFEDEEALELKLMRMRNLQRLVLIDTKLQRNPQLEQVGSTLTSLTLSKQSQLRDFEVGLSLPNLKELFLIKCGIEKVPDLSGCPRVRKLWLSENKIEVLEHLEDLPSLEELHVQGNYLFGLNGLKGNVYLQILDVSRNLIGNLKEVEHLRTLTLKRLVFQSDLFGACPVVDVDQYRSFVICTLPGLIELDGIEIAENHRKNAHDEFLDKQLAFSAKVEEMHERHQDALRVLELKRSRVIKEAQEMKKSLLGQFVSLQEIVKRGRQKIQTSHERERGLREKNFNSLQADLSVLKREYNTVVQNYLHEAKASHARTKAELERATFFAKLDLNEELILSEASKQDPPVAFQVLHSTSPEFKLLANLCQLPDDFNIFKAVKLGMAPSSFTSTEERSMFLEVTNSDALRRILRQSVYSNKSHLLLSPRLKELLSEEKAQENDEIKRFILCKIAFDPRFDVVEASLSSFTDDIEGIGQLSSEERPFVQLESGAYVLRATQTKRILPEFYIVLSKEQRLHFSEAMRNLKLELQQRNGRLPVQIEKRLTQMEEAIDEKVEMHNKRIAQRLHPELAAEIENNEALTVAHRQQLEAVRDEIDSFKSEQEYILQEAFPETRS